MIAKYTPEHPLSEATPEFLVLLDATDPMVADPSGFDLLHRATNSQRVRDWLVGMENHADAVAWIAGRSRY
ncbi:MAG: hypothetical protein Q8O25_08265 [Sulfurisoma sp.]|nr:hypothetical protein [Sulfurisoma sp.]